MSLIPTETIHPKGICGGGRRDVEVNGTADVDRSRSHEAFDRVRIT
jgi:hypothetical protein